MAAAAGKTAMGTAVITGASSGLGVVYADRLGRRGYDLLLVARRADRLEAVAKDLRDRHGVAVRTMVADLGRTEELEQVALEIGGDDTVTMLVNNAGTSAVALLGDTKKESFASLINVNIVALTRLTMAVLDGFKRRDRGTIVNLGSVVGFAGFAYTAIYGGTKAYVLNFTRSLQEELAGTKVRVQLVAPAATVSEIWEVAGYPLANLDPAVVMTTDDCVDAALRGLEMGEATTMPSVQDAQLLANYDTASAVLLAASQQTGRPAPRYAVAMEAAV